MQQRPLLLRRAEPAADRGSLVRLLVCALLFAAAVVCKTVATDTADAIAAAVLRQIDAGLTLREVTELVGRAVTDAGVLDALRDGWGLETFDAGSESAAADAAAQTTQAPAAQTTAAMPPSEEDPVLEAARSPDPRSEPASAQTEAGSAGLTPTVAESAPVEGSGGGGVGDTQENSDTDEALNGQRVDNAAYHGPNGDLPLPDVVTTAKIVIDFDYVLPAKGAVNSGFGYRAHPLDGEYKFHYGIDIDAAVGDPVCAFADGEVSFTGRGDINGNYMKIIHADGVVSMYAHLDKILVKVGDKVKMGQKIALAGESGQVTGPHLHFQLYKDGLLFDPMTVLRDLYYV